MVASIFQLKKENGVNACRRVLATPVYQCPRWLFVQTFNAKARSCQALKTYVQKLHSKGQTTVEMVVKSHSKAFYTDAFERSSKPFYTNAFKRSSKAFFYTDAFKRSLKAFYTDAFKRSSKAFYTDAFKRSSKAF